MHLITLLIELNLDPDDVAGEQVGDIAPPRHGLQHGNGEKQMAARRVSTGPMGRRHLKTVNDLGRHLKKHAGEKSTEAGGCEEGKSCDRLSQKSAI